MRSLSFLVWAVFGALSAVSIAACSSHEPSSESSATLQPPPAGAQAGAGGAAGATLPAGAAGVGAGGGPSGVAGTQGLPGAAGSATAGVGAAGVSAAGTGAGAGGLAGASGAGVAGAAGAAGATTAGSSASACTGKPGMLRGKSVQTVMAAGVARTFVFYAPMTLDANKPAPLVVVPHGYTMSGEEMFGITGYDKVADREGLVIAYPDGEGTNPWNVGQGICGVGSAVNATGDDQSFMNELIKLVDADQCVDHDHIFITGFSMGGYFSNETACMNPAFRAGGPHSGGTHDLSGCTNKHRPMIIFHFKSDSLIDYACGSGARDEWVKHNGCTMDSPDVTMVKGGACEYYKGCPADGQVAFCSFDEPAGGTETITGHAWSGGSAASSGFAIPQTESATELGWQFFKKYAW